MQETWLQSLGQEDPLEEEVATHSSILAWESHRQRSLEGYSPWGCEESVITEHAHMQFDHLSNLGTLFNYQVTIPTLRVRGCTFQVPLMLTCSFNASNTG